MANAPPLAPVRSPTTTSLRRTRRIVLAALLLATACGPPVGVVRMDPRAVHRTLTGNVLSTGEPSAGSRIMLQQRGLAERYEKNPAAALAELHRAVVGGDPHPAEFFALAELSFDHAARGGGRAYHLASAVYAWTFLFESGAKASELDSQRRLAADLYNQGVAAALSSGDGKSVELRPGPHALSFGTLDVELDPKGLRWGDRRLERFVAASDLEVRGLRNRYRDPGLGAPLNATTAPLDPKVGFRDFVFPRVKVPVTALLRLDDVRRGLATGRLRGRLEVYAASEVQRVEIEGRSIPLEFERTSALADTLTDSFVWRLELRGFLSGDFISRERGVRLGGIEPYRPDRIPVLLVHGTASSPGRWADMLNDLESDPRIRERFQFWAFAYDTGNPIAYSAMVLREALAAAVEGFDPEGREACLRQIVVIGHSQGGLLAKLTAVESGSRFWDNVSRKPLEEMNLSAETSDLLRRAMWVRPLPFVRRLIFIATPHRGSYRAAGWVRGLVQRLVSAPKDLARVGTELFTDTAALRLELAVRRIPTSVDNMSPGHPFIRTLADLPLAPGVAAHSIVAVQGDGPFEDGNDGVVQYRSAHLDGVESELVVRSSHSTQSNPATIEEVRRILLLHAAGAFDGDACRPPQGVVADGASRPRDTATDGHARCERTP